MLVRAPVPGQAGASPAAAAISFSGTNRDVGGRRCGLWQPIPAGLCRAPASLCQKKKLMNDGTKELMDPGCGARGALRCCAVTGLPVSLVTAPELARNNHYCLSQSLISKVYIIASLIFSEGCIESSPVGVGLVGKSTGASAEVNEVD